MKILKYTAITIAAILLALFIAGKIYSAKQPGIVQLLRIADTARISSDIHFFTDSCRYRTYDNKDALNKAAAYIKSHFTEISTNTTEQHFSFRTNDYKNIICSIGPQDGERIVIGAHYDVCGEQDGADDNASGVAGMLELARLLKDKKLPCRIDFVAYTLEEPPFFKSEYMGSYIHAKWLHDENVNVKGMICLETIGYFSDAEDSQNYPAFFLTWFYGNRGNFVTVVNKFNGGAFASRMNHLLKTKQVIPTRTFKGPEWLPGVDFSDHLNYWKFGYSALMITNTAFYRNKNYHTTGDSIGSLNVGKIGLVADEVYRALLGL
jgi:hypothetical protein